MGSLIHPSSQEQIKAFECARHLIATYKMISPEHQDLALNKSAVVGDMIADLKYAMSRVWDYPLGDVESVATAAFGSLTDSHLTK